MIDPGLEGKVALVTGANHGIGAETARRLAAHGVRVFVTYLRLQREDWEPYPPEYAENQARSGDDVAAEIRAGGGEVVAFEADLADPATPAALLEHAEAALGPVEILVNNADHCRIDTLLPHADRPTLDAEAIDSHFAVNTRAPALLISELARRHIERAASWGRVVNLSTDGAYCFPGEVSYGVTKFALESLTRAAAAELGPHGITVNTVSPGPIDTGWIGEGLAARVAEATPLGRVGQPEDVADVIVFLCSEQARWVTGQTIHVGGGHRM